MKNVTLVMRLSMFSLPNSLGFSWRHRCLICSDSIGTCVDRRRSEVGWRLCFLHAEAQLDLGRPCFAIRNVSFSFPSTKNYGLHTPIRGRGITGESLAPTPSAPAISAVLRPKQSTDSSYRWVGTRKKT